MKHIKHPENKTFYLIWNSEKNKIILFGFIRPEQVISTPYENLISYESLSEWTNILINNGITQEQIDKKTN
ncbi:MAG: hypothetical protein ACI9Q3_001394 [Maribacter sp.]|jgi:hypothetical protein